MGLRKWLEDFEVRMSNEHYIGDACLPDGHRAKYAGRPQWEAMEPGLDHIEASIAASRIRPGGRNRRVCGRCHAKEGEPQFAAECPYEDNGDGTYSRKLNFAKQRRPGLMENRDDHDN